MATHLIAATQPSLSALHTATISLPAAAVCRRRVPGRHSQPGRRPLLQVARPTRHRAFFPL